MDADYQRNLLEWKSHDIHCFDPALFGGSCYFLIQLFFILFIFQFQLSGKHSLRVLQFFLILLPPRLHRIEDRAECLPERTQRILHPRRHLCIDRADNDTVAFHCTQALSQHLLADAVKRFPQFIEPPRTGKEISQDQQFPFVPDQLYRGRNRAIGQFFSA